MQLLLLIGVLPLLMLYPTIRKCQWMLFNLICLRAGCWKSVISFTSSGNGWLRGVWQVRGQYITNPTLQQILSTHWVAMGNQVRPNHHWTHARLLSTISTITAAEDTMLVA